ncbi:MAG: glycosyltransferase family 2 protein [Nanoarchaeota archaeon]
MNILIPMAGRGSRFLQESSKNPEFLKPKPIITIGRHMMIQWALSSLPIKKEDKLIFLVLKEHIDNFHIDNVLKYVYGESINIISVDKVTEGAACTALLAKELINNEEPLLITDSDHYIDGDTIFKEIDKYIKKIDGMIPVFYANNNKWSFAKTDEQGIVIETAEKLQISRNANIGAYYFSKGRDFVWAAEEMIEENDRVNNEFYIAPVYNYLIRRGKIIRLCRPRFVHGLGTPKDMEKFLEFLKLKEIQLKIDRLNPEGFDISSVHSISFPPSSNNTTKSKKQENRSEYY